MRCLTDRIKREKERKRQEIIDVAEKLFFSEGFKDTSMDEIAQKSEFSKRTVYKYFDSKEELYSAIALRGLELFQKIIVESSQNKNTGLEKLESIACSLINLKKTNINYAKVITYFLNQVFDTDTNGVFIKLCKEKVITIRVLINNYLNQGIEDGSIKNNIDIPKTVMSIQTILVGMYMINDNLYNYFMTNNISFNEIFEYNINLMLGLIKS
ncbi:MAG TPA: TetR/AcrR family transcriptional regulator [Spirochaetota bacterium]|nr:TetR/AcrR family transcriptional regulator [Spirochaetota bacterium]